MKSKRKVRSCKIWTCEDKEVLAKLFKNTYTQTICTILKRTYPSVAQQAKIMGLKKSKDFRQMELNKQGDRLKIVGVASRYQKGFVPANKGKPMPVAVYEKVQATMFKKGGKPHNAYAECTEVLRVAKNGKQYWWIKEPGERKMKHKHAWLWEINHGNIEKGFNVVFKDGNPLNCIIENLECISNTELMQRNTIHRFPEELKSTIKLVNKLKRTIKNGKE